MREKPSYEELEQRVRELEKAETDRMLAEEKLKENEKFLKDVLRASSIGISYTKNRKIVWANETMEQLFGFESEQEYIGMDTAALFADKEDYDRVGKMLFEKNKEKKIQFFDTTWVRKDGTIFEGSVRVNLIDVDDYSKGVITSIVDITARKQAQKALRQSEENYRVLVENAGDAIFIAQDGMIKFSNKRSSELLGYEINDLVSVPFLNFIHPDDREMVRDKHIRRLKGETDLPSTYSFRIIRKDCSERLVQLNTAVFEWQNSVATLNFVRDITDQKKLETSFYQAQKLEALGTLAGGIAHDFNNLLMGIQGRASLLGLGLDPSSRQKEHIEAIEEYVQSAAALTKQLLGLASRGKYDVKPVNIDDLLLTTAAMFGRTRKEIRIHPPRHPSALVIDADRRQIEQLILNLLINAWQAMPEGGEIFLETSMFFLDDETGRSYQLSAGHYCRISVTDTGFGMDKAVMQRIFDPFFTTKEKGRGTGLGLASAFGIARSHNGSISVYSEVGHGSTFNIYLPISDQKAIQENIAEEEVSPGSETVLLVDDEEIIIDVGKEMLEILGYDAITACGGGEALDTVRRKGNEINLVILDMIMPGMDGSRTFDRIHELRPDLPVILSSGYAVNKKAAGILNRGCSGFIQKPFTIAELSKKIRETLDQPETLN